MEVGLSYVRIYAIRRGEYSQLPTERLRVNHVGFLVGCTTLRGYGSQKPHVIVMAP